MGYNSNDATTEIATRISPASSPVTELEIHCSKMPSADLTNLLTACASLTTFIYEVGCAWAWTPVRTSDISTAPVPHEQSLVSLCLDHEDYYPFQDATDEDDASPICFTTSALKVLKTAPVYVFGATRSMSLIKGLVLRCMLGKGCGNRCRLG